MRNKLTLYTDLMQKVLYFIAAPRPSEYWKNFRAETLAHKSPRPYSQKLIYKNRD